MIIEKIEIESFAAIKELTLELSDGLNLIEGSNESGKSSIADFIKFVLYGVSGKGTEGHLSERKRAINYLDSHAGGSLCVRIGERRYRITRNTSVSGSVRESVRSKFSLRDMESGADISDGREPGEQLLGIPESVFFRSAYLRQCGQSELCGSDVHAAISNILFSGDERLSVERAAERIDSARIPLAHKHANKGRIFELKSEISELSEKLKHSLEANEQILTLAASAEDKEKTNSEHILKYEALKKQKRAYECAKTLESFEQLSKAEAKKVSSELNMLEYKGEAHIPTDAEMDELHSYEISINTLSSSLADTQASRARLEAEAEKLNISKKLRQAVECAGGADALFSSAECAQAASRRFAVLSVISILLGCVLGGACFALPSLMLALLSGAAVFFVGFLVFATLSAAKKKKLREICSVADCKNTDELDAALEAYESSKLRMQVLEESMKENEQREAEYKGLITAERERLREFLLDMDIEDNVESTTSISKISETLKARSRRCAELEAEANTARAYYEGLLLKTERFDAQKLKEELDSLGVAEPLECDMEKTVQSMSFYREQSKLLSDKIHELQIKLAELRATLTPPSSIRERMNACAKELESAEKRLSAYILASDSLRAAAEELRRSIAPTLSAAAGEYMSTLTDGRFGALSLDASFALSYEAHGEQRHIDYMSTGTQDMAYLCLRLALSDIISKEGALPIILDEATAHMDDTRAQKLLSLLCMRSESKTQHVLFTCHGRERQLLLSCGCEHNYIKL